MEKTIKIGDKEVRLNNNVGWAMIYRDQFGRDILQTLTPMFASALDVIGGIISETGKTKSFGMEDLLAVMDGDSLLDALAHIGTFEFVDVINLTWALAKTADEDLPDPKVWVREFDTFPIDVIAPEVFGLLIGGLVSSKNLRRLEEIKTELRPESTSTPSSSQDSNEG